MTKTDTNRTKKTKKIDPGIITGFIPLQFPGPTS